MCGGVRVWGCEGGEGAHLAPGSASRHKSEPSVLPPQSVGCRGNQMDTSGAKRVTN